MDDTPWHPGNEQHLAVAIGPGLVHLSFCSKRVLLTSLFQAFLAYIVYT